MVLIKINFKICQPFGAVVSKFTNNDHFKCYQSYLTFDNNAAYAIGIYTPQIMYRL